MSVENATNVSPSGIQIAYERFGDPLAPPILGSRRFEFDAIGVRERAALAYDQA